MRKQEIRGKVLDRVPGRYPRSVVAVLAKIIDLTSVPDWKTSDIEGFSSKPKTDAELAFLTNLERHTVHRALKVLLHDGLINPSTRERNSYTVNPDQVLLLPSIYKSKRTRALEQKIYNAIRMKFARNPEKVPLHRRPNVCVDGRVGTRSENCLVLHVNLCNHF